IVFALLLLVAVVAEFATLPAVVIVASFVSTMAAAGSISALTISDVERLPLTSLWTIPAVENPLIDIVPPDDILSLSVPFVFSERLPPLAERPVVVLPVKVNDGDALVPAGSCKVP